MSEFSELSDAEYQALMLYGAGSKAPSAVPFLKIFRKFISFGCCCCCYFFLYPCPRENYFSSKENKKINKEKLTKRDTCTIFKALNTENRRFFLLFSREK